MVCHLGKYPLTPQNKAGPKLRYLVEQEVVGSCPSIIQALTGPLLATTILLLHLTFSAAEEIPTPTLLESSDSSLDIYHT